MSLIPKNSNLNVHLFISSSLSLYQTKKSESNHILETLKFVINLALSRL